MLARILFAFLFCVASSSAQSRIDEALRAAVDDGVIVGAQAYVGRADEVLLDQVYGRIRPDREAKVDAETLFCIGSVSKPLASTIALGLAEDGKLDLEAPVSRYVAAFRNMAAPPTIRQLLAHRGGIYTQRRQMSASQTRWIRDFRLTLAEAVEGIAREPLVAEPGALFAYSGAGYCVLGRALEVAAGADMEALLRQRLAKPLGWKRTSYFPSPGDANVASGADSEGRPHPLTPHLLGAEYRLALVGGSVYSSARELARFAGAMAEGGKSLLPAAAYRKALLRPYPEQPYGFGWSLQGGEEGKPATGLRHNGSLAASRATLNADLETGAYTVVVYTVAGTAGEAEKRVAAAVGGPSD